MRRFITICIGLLMLMLPCQCTMAQVGYSKTTRTFGDYTNSKPAPTTGTLTGTYRTGPKPWVQTGPITCNACRLFFGGPVTFNDAITATPGVEGNAAPTGILSSDGSFGSSQMGTGPGGGLPVILGGGTNTSSGGGHGGLGGAGIGPQFNQPGGATYPNELYLAGSSGGGSVPTSGVAGAGGGGFYVEAIGNVTFANGTILNANGGAATTVGSGGAGGGVDIRSYGTVTVQAGAIITATGGAGASATYPGGGGGIITLMSGPGKSTVNAGTVTANGGAAGSGGNAGALGLVNGNPTFNGPRLNY